MMAIKNLRTALVLASAAWALHGSVMAAPNAIDAAVTNAEIVVAQNAAPQTEPRNQGELLDQVEFDPEEDTGPNPLGQNSDFLDDEDEALSPQEILDMERAMDGQR